MSINSEKMHRDEEFDPEPNLIATVADVSRQDISEKIIKADTSGMDGRSHWKWFRLSNGDLIFGCYPQGDMYFETELDPNRP